MSARQKKSGQPDAVDIKIAEISLANPHMTDEEIGLAVGLSRGAVNRRKRRDGYHSIFTKALQDAQKDIMILMRKATAVLGTSLEDPDSRVRLLAATHILKHMPEIILNPDLQKNNIVIDLGWADSEKQNEIVYKTNWGSPAVE